MSTERRLSRTKDIPTQIKNPDLVNRRRRQIADAAVQLFIDNGFHKTTTRQIACKAGVSIGSLYEYIASNNRYFRGDAGPSDGEGVLPDLDESAIELAAHNISVLGHMWSFRRWYLARHYRIEDYINLQTEFILGLLNKNRPEFTI